MDILSLKLREEPDDVPVHVFVPSAAHRKGGGGVIFYMDAFGLRPGNWTRWRNDTPMPAMSRFYQIFIIGWIGASFA